MDLSIAVTLVLSVSLPHSVVLSEVMVTGDGAYTLMFSRVGTGAGPVCNRQLYQVHTCFVIFVPDRACFW